MRSKWITLQSLEKKFNVLSISVTLLFLYEFLLLQSYNDYINFWKNATRIAINENSEATKIDQGLRLKTYDLKNGSIFIPSSLKQIDWHNYTLIEEEKRRTGIGEHGNPASLPEKERCHETMIYTIYGYSGDLSDKLPLNRSLPDHRHPDCQKKLYLESLPEVSVVIVFHNEHYTTLLRTVFSVLHRSPKNLIKEVVLVDDASDNNYLLKDPLEHFLKDDMPKVKVIRMMNRTGLAAARMSGAKVATADVLVFLDSHTEANVNWLPPLLEPIALDYRTVVLPIVDKITYHTFEYIGVDQGARGSFNWELTYMRLALTPKDEKNLPEPFETPIMMGGLFAISRTFFLELGGYDPELRIWGGEQFEISFKIWQCGGRMLEAPCSRVGHVYRNFDPPGQGNYTARNYRRVAEVWMDEYAQYVYARRPDVQNVDPGDVTEQKELRKKLQCKPFKWFITQIAFDLTQQFPVVDHLPYAEGRIRTERNPRLCIDANYGKWNGVFILKKCHSKHQNLSVEEDEQQFELTGFNDVKLKPRHICWDVKKWLAGTHITLYPCHRNGGNQQWRYDQDLKMFMFSDTDLCLDHNPNNRDLFLNYCHKEYDTQRWDIETVHIKRLAAWNKANSIRVTGPLEEWKE